MSARFLIGGGASGIGAACATTLAREGAKVVVTDVDDADGQAVVDKIESAGGLGGDYEFEIPTSLAMTESPWAASHRPP